jgi:hypothetical protein
MSTWDDEFHHNPLFFEEQRLGQLAMRFRSSGDKGREQVVAEYADTVRNLIKSGKWNEVPGPEDQLPDDLMPGIFFEYWQEKAREQSDR